MDGISSVLAKAEHDEARACFTAIIYDEWRSRDSILKASEESDSIGLSPVFFSEICMEIYGEGILEDISTLKIKYHKRKGDELKKLLDIWSRIKEVKDKEKMKDLVKHFSSMLRFFIDKGIQPKSSDDHIFLRWCVALQFDVYQYIGKASCSSPTSITGTPRMGSAPGISMVSVGNRNHTVGDDYHDPGVAQVPPTCSTGQTSSSRTTGITMASDQPVGEGNERRGDGSSGSTIQPAVVNLVNVHVPTSSHGTTAGSNPPPERNSNIMKHHGDDKSEDPAKSEYSSQDTEEELEEYAKFAYLTIGVSYGVLYTLLSVSLERTGDKRDVMMGVHVWSILMMVLFFISFYIRFAKDIFKIIRIIMAGLLLSSSLIVFVLLLAYL